MKIDDLSNLKRGESALVVGIKEDCDIVVRQRFLDLGFVKGAKVVFENISPMGNPISYTIHATQIALRVADAKFIKIQKIEEDA